MVIMKIGYPCINRSIGCSGAKRFMLKNYSKERFLETTRNNIDCLEQMLVYNLDHDLLFFRVSSDLIPFASHPVCDVDWRTYFATDFERIGELIHKHEMRISMHPDQFILINSPKEEVFQRSAAELTYHTQLMESLGLNTTHKIQIHVGGVYEDKQKSMERFASRFKQLPKVVQGRLAIENDDVSYDLADCLVLSKQLSMPVIFDVFHHSVKNRGEGLVEALHLAAETWDVKRDGVLMVDYSSQAVDERVGKHAESIDADDFGAYLDAADGIDMDVMLEIKDKEASALVARKLMRQT